MPVRSTLDSSKALQMSGFGIQEGRVLIDDSRFKIIQRQKGEKKGGGLVTPMLVLQLDCRRVNENNVAESDAVELTELVVAWGSKIAATEGDVAGLHSFALWPGMLKGDAADVNAEIEDLSVSMADEKRAYVRIDTEGNTFVSADGAVPFADCEAMLFMKSLEQKGWKAEINNQAFAGNYKGAIIDVKTVLKEDLCKRLGIKFQKQADADPNRPATCWEVTAIHVRPYEKGAGTTAKSKKSSSTTSTASSKVNGSEQVSTSSTTDPKITAAMESFLKTQTAGSSMSQVDFQKKIGVALMGPVGIKDTQAFINANVKPIETLAALGFEFGFEVDVEKKTVTFGAE